MSKLVNISDEVKRLDMEFNYGELKFVTGDEFTVSVEGADTEKIQVEVQDDVLRIYDERKNTKIKTKNLFFGKSLNFSNCDITITIPRETRFDRVSLHTGAVEVHVDELYTGILIMEMGVGDIEIESLEVSNYGKVSMGTGDVEIHRGIFNDTDMHLGVGVAEIQAKFTGESGISSGVGELRLILQGNPEEYCVGAYKGVGSVSVEGLCVSGNTCYGTGQNKVNVSGGVGAINIQME